MEDSTPKPDIRWKLEAFTSPSDPELLTRKNVIKTKADKLLKKYKGQINTSNTSPNLIFQLLTDLDEYYYEYYEYSQYARLKFAANMTKKENQQLFNEMQELQTQIGKKLTFISLEIRELLKKKPDMVNEYILRDYKHYLERQQRSIPHTLSEVEEQLILEKDQYGINAWSNLQSTWLNTRKFHVKIKGEPKTLSYGDANGLLSHPDRSTRTSANKSIYGKLGEDQEIFSSALRNVCADWVNIYKRRNYKSTLGQSLIANDIDEQTIMNLMNTVKNHNHIYQKYLQAKAKLMELPILGCEDIVAPLPNSPDIEYPWDKTRELILTAYGNFDAEVQSFVKNMFDREHIDASPRFGKRNGAFCSGWHKGKSAYVLMSFNENMGSVYTLAHELGHAVHDYYLFRNQSPLNSELSMCVAETASIFGELLMTDLLLDQAQNDNQKLAILTHILDEAGMAIFQVSSRFWFEHSLYEAVEEGIHLDGDTIAEKWVNARTDVYGERVEWFEEMRWEWTMKPHYYIPNFRYYNYPYVYAQLFVFSLYKVYKDHPKEFTPKLKTLLKAGSSISAKEAGNIMGLDVSSPEFWKLGLELFSEFSQRVEKIMNKR